ncbi:MAG: 23S rRNA (adenine(2503)-C(2))-methyltransferase RlmN [Candidatus Buchananbacteria bacterium]|nr:23S rRNA (adenine(2503)-C(2))-methyltransferase RlmN [Candidatus Buchananbacteria bacterium]
MNLKLLKNSLKNEPAYRFKQCQQVIWHDLIDDWQKAFNLPQKLRVELNQKIPLELEAKIIRSDDKKTIKALITLIDDKKIETVLMRHNDGRNTVCVSSQVGCPLGCLFCSTGQVGYKRNLEIDEIITQVLFFARLLKKENKKVTNVVFMGMGEPFLNYDNVIEAIKILNNKDYFNIGARHISISTIGLPEDIYKLSKENLQINLAISLHAPNNKLRDKLIPLNKKYSLNQVLTVVKDYIKETNRRVMIEYIMLKDFNDSEQAANQLVELLKYLPSKLYLLNLILYNKGDFLNNKFQPSSPKNVALFKHILGRNKINVTERHRFGKEIDAACGQLANKYNH